MSQINGFHAHIYYDENTYEKAQRLCQTAKKQLPISVGHMHTEAVGPHPCWSAQWSFGVFEASEVISWLCLNRNGLTIFIHPITSNHLKDHAHHAIWMGEIKPLKLSIFAG